MTATEIISQKHRGAYYTPPNLAAFLVRWAVRAPADRALDPSCGDGSFLRAISDLLEGWNVQPRHGQVVGYEFDAEAAAQARASVPFAMVREGDFFAREPEDELFDAVVGNPPYIRYHHFYGEVRARAMARAEREGVVLSGLASSWAPFVVHASTFLRPGGRLAFVLPAELLSTDYAGAIRAYVQRRFARVDILTFDERVFPGALVDVVLLLAEGDGPGAVTVHRLPTIAALADFAADRAVAPAGGGLAPLEESRWTEALVAPAAAAALAHAATRMIPLGAIATVDIGLVTGANKFFLLDERRVKDFGLSPRDRRRLIARASQFGGHALTGHIWESQRRAGAEVWLFTPRSATGAAGRYIRHGEEQGVHTGYKCSVRTPWWKLKLVRPPDLILSYMSNHVPRLVANTAAVLTTNILHNVRLRANASDARLLALSWPNSATLLSCELSGRSYGGGVLKLETKEAERVLTPMISDAIAAELRAKALFIDAFLAQGRFEDAADVVDPIVLGHLPVPQRALLRAAWRDLKERRKQRATPAEEFV